MEFLYVFFLVMTTVSGGKKGCGRLEGCSRDFQINLEEAGIKEPEASLKYCQELRSFGQCVKRTTKGCRGDLTYHSSSSLVDAFAKRYNCSQHKIRGERRQNHTPTTQIPCTYPSLHLSNHKICGLYGAPDLRTFSKNYQRCNIVGSWPLLDNDYLAVQITNSPIMHQSMAIATTKVTVIIKATENGCSSEKTYEATSETSLPEYFIDGTDTSGRQNSVLINTTIMDRLRIVNIYLRYIDTKISVRQTGPYLGCSVTMPEEIIGNIENSGEVELCRRGCSRAHQITDGRPWPHWCSREQIENITSSGDWCVFELMSGILAEPAVADLAFKFNTPILFIFVLPPLITYSLYF